jgi:DNA topoisomerase-6 subunit B
MADTGADKLFKDFREHSVAAFFKKNRQMLGYSGKVRSLTTIAHEYITNSLDACEEGGILPEIYIKIERLGPEHYRVTEQDNGPGIPRKHVGGVFAKMLAGTKFHRFIQARGQQGIGGSGCTMYSQITTGKPTKVTTSAGDGVIYEVDLMIDVKRNQPLISAETKYPGEFRGTKVSAEFKGVVYNKSEYGPGEYIRRSAISNPHARITYIDPEGLKTVYDRAVNAVPKVPKEVKPHPTGVTVDDLLDYALRSKSRTIRTFLQDTFTRMSAAKAGEIQELTSIDFRKKPSTMTWQEAEEIIDAIKRVKFLSPSSSELIPIGENRIDRSLENILQPEFHAVITRNPSVYRGGVPFIVEAGIAYGGDAGRGEKTEMMRFANRAPLLFDSGGCAITKTVSEVEWRRYGIRDLEKTPLSIFVNVVSTYIPYTSAGKQAIADEEEIVKEIKYALMDCGRKVKTYLSRKRKKYEKHVKRSTLVRYVPEVARAVSELTGKEESAEKVEKELMELIVSRYGKEEEVGDVSDVSGEDEEEELPVDEEAEEGGEEEVMEE